MAGHDHFGLVGRVIDAKYRVERAVDEGTFGVVYRAHHLKFDERVALKCLKLPRGLQGPALDDFCQRFVAEGRFLHRLSRANTNIVQALDVGAELAEGGAWVPYLVLEWLEGVSLADDLEARARRGEGGRGLAATMALLEPAALALAAAHEQRVAHCDVKPANLFIASVAGRPTLKVLDFGIAKFADEHVAKELTDDGETFCAFSPFYAAPEQFDRSFGATGPATDVFSLALVLVEVASGRLALEGESVAALFRAASDPASRPTLRARGVGCPAAVDEVIGRALAVRPDERFASAADFWQALDRAVAAEASAHVASVPSLPVGRSAGDERPARPEREASGGFATDAITAAASGEPPASGASAAPAAPAGYGPPHRSPLGAAVALGLGATLALAVAHRGRLPGVHAVPQLARVAAPSPYVDAALSSSVGARVLSRLGVVATAALGAIDAGRPALAAGAPPSPLAPAGAGRTAAGATSDGVEPEPSTDFTLRPLGREASLDYQTAARECAKGRMALCTEAQWQLACDAGAPLGNGETWTTSLDEQRAVVRGGDGGCGARRLHPASQPLRTRGQACCAGAASTDERPAPSSASLSSSTRTSR